MAGTIKYFTDFFGGQTKHWLINEAAAIEDVPGRTGLGRLYCPAPWHAAAFDLSDLDSLQIGVNYVS